MIKKRIEKINKEKFIVSHSRNRPLFAAKLGTGPGNLLLIRGVRSFYIGQRIKYIEQRVFESGSTHTILRWQSGLIYDINENYLFVEKF